MNTLMANIMCAFGGNNVVCSEPLNSLINIFGGGPWAEFANWLLGGLITIAYTVYKWVLALIDFCFILVRQLVGINTDFSSLQNIQENDVIFQFIFSDNVMTVIKSLFWLAIVLIIVFAIIALIKSDFAAVASMDPSGEIKNDKGKIWKSIGESILLLVLIPMVLFGSLIMCNAVLAGLYNATGGNNSNPSLGGQIFVASSYNANAYRLYASNNKKIPITYEFKQVTDYTAFEYDSSGTVAQIDEAIRTLKSGSGWAQGYATHEMFYHDEFFNMEDVDYMQHTEPQKGVINVRNANSYNTVYDNNIQTYRYEYFVNADLVDYLMRSGTTVYVMSLQEVFESQKDVINPIISVDNADTPTQYSISVNYKDGGAPLQYVHKANAADEADGAVFVACIKRTLRADNVEKEYFEPLTTANSSFASEYINDGQMIVLRGIFDEGRYPTAIKKVDGVVQYYRDEVQVPTFFSFFPHISYELPAGATQSTMQSLITGAFQFITGVNINDFIPYIYWDIDLMNLFTKGTYTVSSLSAKNAEGGAAIRLDYMFSMRGTNMDMFYFKININIIILVLASATIIGRILASVFGAMRRFVDIMFLYIMYPAAVATIPLFGKSSLGRWIKQITQKMFSAYGLVLGLNLGLALVPLSEKIVLVTPQMMEGTFLSFLPNMFTATCVNYIIQLLFTLVGINFIFRVGKVISYMLFDEAKSPDKAVTLDTMGDEVIKGTQEVYKKAGEVISGKALMDKVKGLKGWVPGMAIVDDIKERKNHLQTMGAVGSQFGGQYKSGQDDLKKSLQQAKDAKKAARGNDTTGGGGGGNPAPGGGTPGGGNPGGGSGGGDKPSAGDAAKVAVGAVAGGEGGAAAAAGGANGGGAPAAAGAGGDAAAPTEAGTPQTPPTDISGDDGTEAESDNPVAPQNAPSVSEPTSSAPAPTSDAISGGSGTAAPADTSSSYNDAVPTSEGGGNDSSSEGAIDGQKASDKAGPSESKPSVNQSLSAGDVEAAKWARNTLSKRQLASLIKKEKSVEKQLNSTGPKITKDFLKKRKELFESFGFSSMAETKNSNPLLAQMIEDYATKVSNVENGKDERTKTLYKNIDATSKLMGYKNFVDFNYQNYKVRNEYGDLVVNEFMDFVHNRTDNDLKDNDSK